MTDLVGWPHEPLAWERVSLRSHFGDESVGLGPIMGTSPSEMPAAVHAHGVVCHEEPKAFEAAPDIPTDLWDTEDERFLDKVKVDGDIRLRKIDPKNGSFEGRLKLHWMLRTTQQHLRTEPRVRVPGIRWSRLSSTVEESRVWRDISKDSDATTFWQGTTSIEFSGYELFEVQDFPFDRQIINLDLFEFVWRKDMDSMEFEESMQVVQLSIQTVSMLPDWDTYPALIRPLELRHAGGGPASCSRFSAKLRIQRKPSYYVVHIFLLSYLIFAASLLPLGMEPGDTHIADRLALHSGGLLTLVSFRYSVADELPCVPYSTFTHSFLNLQVITLALVAVESLGSYKLVVKDWHSGARLLRPHAVNIMEDILLVVLLVGWGGVVIYVSCFKRMQAWYAVLENQQDSTELEDEFMPSPCAGDDFNPNLTAGLGKVDDAVSTASDGSLAPHTGTAGTRTLTSARFLGEK